jgi:hypothetical protein
LKVVDRGFLKLLKNVIVKTSTVQRRIFCSTEQNLTGPAKMDFEGTQEDGSRLSLPFCTDANGSKGRTVSMLGKCSYSSSNNNDDDNNNNNKNNNNNMCGGGGGDDDSHPTSQ